MSIVALSPETLERLAEFVEVFETYDLWRSTLPAHERAIVSQYDTRVLVIESRDTQPLPVVTVDSSFGETLPDDTPQPDSEEAGAASPSSATTNKRGRRRSKSTS